MRLDRIIARPVTDPSRFGRKGGARQQWSKGTDAGNSMGRHVEFTGQGARLQPPWPAVACVIVAEDGTFGLGMTDHSGPVCPLINDHFGPLIKGESALATERLWDMMFRVAQAYGVFGIASHAISAIDLALWDLKGKLLGRPAYELMGGPARPAIRCYATGHDFDWYRELGFEAIKLCAPFAEARGNAAIDACEAIAADARATLGASFELMLDCWPISEASFVVRLAEQLRPYRLGWLEDFLYPEDMASLSEVRRRLPWQTLATGERWHTPLPFKDAAARRLIDIFQPDVQWAGGATSVLKIGHIAEAAGIGVALHGGMNDAYGQHLAYAMPTNIWGELYIDSAPGVPLEDGWRPTPGMALPKGGYLVPSDAPGFGITLNLDQIEAATA